MRRLALTLIVAFVPMLSVAAGSWLSIACAGEGEGEGEGEGDDGVTEVGDGGADDTSPLDVDGSALPLRIFGVANGSGVHAGLTGFYRVSGLTPGASIDVTLEDFLETFTGCPSTSSIHLTGETTLEIFGGANGVDCPTATVVVAADGSILIFWEGDSPEDYGLKLAAH